MSLHDFTNGAREREVEPRAGAGGARQRPARDLTRPVTGVEQVAKSHIGKATHQARIGIHRHSWMVHGSVGCERGVAASDRTPGLVILSELQIRVSEPGGVVSAANGTLPRRLANPIHVSDRSDVG